MSSKQRPFLLDSAAQGKRAEYRLASNVVLSHYCRRPTATAIYERVKDMLIAAIIFVMSMAVVIQFGVLSWHAGLIRVASEPLVAGRELPAFALAKPLIAEDFYNITAYGKLCPDFSDGSFLKLRSVRAYYRALQVLKSAGHMAWAAREMGLCTRYAAVMLSRRLDDNQAMLASVRAL